MADQGEIVMPVSCIVVILDRMKLTHDLDAELLPSIQRWVRHERPEFMPTTVFAVSLLVQRLARAFACRGTTNPTAAKTSASTGKSSASTMTTSKTENSNSTPTSTGVVQQEPSSTKNAQEPQSISGSTSAAPRKPKTPKKKPFRSLKKLDLSPNVVNSLRGFVADLASCVPLILRQVEYEQYRDAPHLAVKGQTHEPFTAVEILDITLKMLEGDASTSRPVKNAVSKTKGNAAMEVFRNVLAEFTQKQKNEDGTYSSVMDELKFKTFCLKVLECAVSHSISTVESFYDYRRMYDVAHQQHSISFTPHKGTTEEQQLMIWILAVYIVWRRQEEHPSLCSRKERILATAVSMVVSATLPLLHRHPEPTALEENAEMANESAIGPAADENNAVANSAIGSDAAVDLSGADARDSSGKEGTASTATDMTSNPAKPDVAGSIGTTEGDSNKRTAPTARDDSNSIKKQKVDSEDVSGGVLKENPSLTDASSSSPPLPRNATANGGGRKQTTTCRPLPNCSYCLKQEQIFQIITHVTKQSCSFLDWAIKSSSDDDSVDISRTELDRTLNKVMRYLSSFSDAPPIDDGNVDEEDPPYAWLELLQNTIGVRDDSKMTIKMAESKLFSILREASAHMMKGEEERKGTRVEAVPYVPERILAEGGVWEYVEYICPTISGRRKQENQVAACVPMTYEADADDGVDEPTLAKALAPAPGSQVSYEPQAVSRTSTQPATQSATQKGAQPTAMNPRLLMIGEAHNKLISNNRAVSPPVVTESMELNEWTIAVLSSLTIIRPTPNLRKRLDSAAEKANGDPGNVAPITWANIIVPLLNRFVARMRHAAEGASTAPLPLVVDGEGEVQTTRRTQDTQLWAAIIQVYYHSLECILYFEGERLGTLSNPRLVLSDSFHEALMACSYLCVIRAVELTGKIHVFLPQNHQIYTILPISGCTPYSYLKVTESFLRALTTVKVGDDTVKKLNEAFGALPRILQKEMKTSEVRVIESLVWVRETDQGIPEGSIVNAIAELKQSSQWPPECLEPTLPEELEDLGDNAKEHKAQEPNSKDPDFLFVSFIMRKLLKIAYFRIQAVCQILKVPTEYPVASQVWLAFRFLLRNHVELLYGRHIDQWILCTVYGICKIMKYEPDITFARIIDVYVDVRGKDLGVGTCQAIVRHVKILDGAGDENDGDTSRTTKMGDIIRLYNLVFVPIMKSYLLHSKSLRKNAVLLKKEIAKDRFRQSLSANKSNSDAVIRGQSDETVSASVREGNVSIQVTVGDNSGSTNLASPKRTTTMMMIDQQHNDLMQEYIPGAPPHDSPIYRTFLQFGRAKSLAHANEMIAEAARP